MSIRPSPFERIRARARRTARVLHDLHARLRTLTSVRGFARAPVFAPVVLVGTAVLAAVLPARRATGADPLESMRAE